jgi:hypothetical protein
MRVGGQSQAGFRRRVIVLSSILIEAIAKCKKADHLRFDSSLRLGSMGRANELSPRQPSCCSETAFLVHSLHHTHRGRDHCERIDATTFVIKHCEKSWGLSPKHRIDRATSFPNVTYNGVAGQFRYSSHDAVIPNGPHVDNRVSLCIPRASRPTRRCSVWPCFILWIWVSVRDGATPSLQPVEKGV